MILLNMRRTFLPIIIVAFGVFLFSSFGAFAMEADPESAFYSVVDVRNSTSNLRVPTVLELSFSKIDFSRANGREIFLVKDETTSEYIPSYYKIILPPEIPVSVTSDQVPSVGFTADLARRDSQGYAEFGLPASGNGKVAFTLTFAEPVTASAVSLLLAPHVAPPISTSVSVIKNGADYPLLRDCRMCQYFRFMETTSAVWKVSFDYAQPLRIEKIIVEQASQQSATRALRFLAQPGHKYKVFFNADRIVSVFTKEGGDLSNDKDVIIAPAEKKRSNELYKAADVDADHISDVNDNCIFVANTDQKDIDGNGSGDACDDFDRDGIINSRDNCPNNPNYGQIDADGDGVGDVCDQEESRFTEAHKWVPWAGMGAALLVLVILGYYTVRSGGFPKDDIVS